MSQFASLPTIDDRDFWQSQAARAAIEASIAHDLDSIPPKPPLPSAADYLAARRTQNRNLLDEHWRTTRPQLQRLVAERLLKGNQPHVDSSADRLLNWIFALAYEPTWVVSAHLPNSDLPTSGEGQLDLAACEMAGELAETLELLSPWIAHHSSTLAKSIISEIDRRTLVPILTTMPWWADPQKPHTNNWTGVCAGSLLSATCSLRQGQLKSLISSDLSERLDRTTDRLIELLNYFLRSAFTESGECDEGIGYWCYGVEFACMGLSRLDEATFNSRIDLDRLRMIASYPRRAHMFGNTFFCGNDSGPRAGAPRGSMRWLARVTQDPFLDAWLDRHPGELRTVGQLVRRSLDARSPTNTPSLEAFQHPQARLLPDQQAAIFQSQTGKSRLIVTISGGHNAEQHNHNDLGTFQIYLGDKVLIPDLGAPRYRNDFFKHEIRYSHYIVAMSSGHCCPSINGFEQKPGRDAASTLLHFDPKTLEVAFDLTSAYPADAQLRRWTRHLHVPDHGGLSILDDHFELAPSDTHTHHIVHRIWFVDRPIIHADHSIVVGPLSITLNLPPNRVHVETFDPGDPRLLLREFPQGTPLYRLDLTYVLGPTARLDLQTRIAVTQ